MSEQSYTEKLSAAKDTVIDYVSDTYQSASDKLSKTYNDKLAEIEKKKEDEKYEQLKKDLADWKDAETEKIKNQFSKGKENVKNALGMNEEK